MADNIIVSEGTGKTVATEELGGVQYQKIKVFGGQTGSTSMMGVNPDGSINVSILGALSAGLTSTSASVIAVIKGSVATVATGNQSVSGVIDANIRGSVAAVIIGGSIAATFTPPASQSVSGAVTAPPGSVMQIRTDNASVIAVLQSSSIIGIVQGSVTAIPTGNQSVSGTITTPPGSVTAVRTDNASVITVNQSSSVIAVVTGSVVAIPQFSSIIAVVTGSVATVFQGSVITVPTGSVTAVIQGSIAGTYAEDAASASGDKGLLVMGARNDTLSSITSADGDYSSHVVGPSGELIAANAPFTKWISGTADLRVVLGTSVAVLAAPGVSIFTYVTGVQVANMGPASVLVTLAGGLGSILGYTIAPAGGGSNILYPNALKTGENSKFTASLSGTASVLVSAQGFTAKI